DRLLADLARLTVLERDLYGQRAGEGEVLLAALRDGRHGIVEADVLEDDRQVARVVLDRRDIVDRLAQSAFLGVDKPVEGLALDVDQVGQLDGVLEPRESTALASRATSQKRNSLFGRTRAAGGASKRD